MVDYWDEKTFGPFVSDTDKLPRNVIQIFTDACIVTVRPSGTEPKLKFYCQLLPADQPTTALGMELLQEVRARAEAVARQVYNDLLARLDLSLGEAGLLLPDMIDLNRKQEFEQDTIPRLRQALLEGAFTRLDDLLAWLRGEVAAMIPGADPLPALKAPLAYLCAQWSEEIATAPLLPALAGWAQR
jgi:hypothetical protein